VLIVELLLIGSVLDEVAVLSVLLLELLVAGAAPPP